jgi:hypothetical protein
LASLEFLEEAGWEWIYERALWLAGQLAGQLTELGLEVRSRGASTLVSWRVDDPQGEVERLAAAGFVVRYLSAFSLVRASVGAWSSEDELEQLAHLAAGS